MMSPVVLIATVTQQDRILVYVHICRYVLVAAS